MDTGIKETLIYVQELYPQRSVAEKSVKCDSRMDFKRSFVHYIIMKLRTVTEIFQGKNAYESQYEMFQDAMGIPLIIGQRIGLLPVTGITERDVDRMRFNVRSLRFLYNITICLIQMAATILCLFKLLDGSMSVRKLGNFSFYLTTCLTSIVFLKLATRWRYVMKQVIASNLDEYIDASVKFKCYCATITLLGSALIEHILVLIARVSVVVDCFETEDGVYAAVIEKMIFWIFSMDVTYHFPMGIVLLVVNFITTLNWSYSHVFIICISFYLVSILEQINKKIKSRVGEYLPPSHWQKLREDYNRAALLINTFDDAISGVVFFSFASNLFFVCLQLFNSLSNVMTIYANVADCPHYPSGPFQGYELPTYYLYSLFFIISRFLAVALIASSIHTASRVAEPCLYSLPSTFYCTEVQRFIQQIQGSFIALSGFNYFYVTRGLILSVAGTVVTYELVLLQMSD